MPENQEIARKPDGTYEKGVSGNPKGRPKFSIVSLLRDKLAEVPEGEKVTTASRLVDEIIAKAVKEKDVTMMRDILDRIDGKPKQSIVGSDDQDDSPVRVTVRYE